MSTRGNPYVKDKYLKQCHQYVDPQPYYNDCLIDYCYVENEITRCGLIESYVQVCKQHFPADEQENALCEWTEKAKCGENCGKDAQDKIPKAESLVRKIGAILVYKAFIMK